MRRFVVFSSWTAAALLSTALGAREPAAPTFATELPFRSCEGLICIDVALDGAVPRTLMLDTRNANSTLIADVAKQLSWTLQPAQRNGKAVQGIYIGGEHRAALGGVQAPTQFFIFDRALLGEYKPPVDGSIAYTWFKDRILQIDYPRHMLRISNVIGTPVADTPQGPGSLKLAFGNSGPPVIVGSPFTVNGKRVTAQIDTVFTGTMLIYDSAAERLGLAKQGAPELFRYTDGGVNLLASSAQSLGFGSRAVLDGKPALYFAGDGKNPVHQPDGLFDATVGNALFVNSVVTMNFHDMTLNVEPAAAN